MTLIRPRLGNAPVPRTRISNGRTPAVASRMAVTISGTRPSSVSPRNLTVRCTWPVSTTLRDGLALRRSAASWSRAGLSGTSTAMNPRNVIDPPPAGWPFRRRTCRSLGTSRGGTLLNGDLQDAQRGRARHLELVGQILDADRIPPLREGCGMGQGEIAGSQAPRKGEEEQAGDEE